MANGSRNLVQWIGLIVVETILLAGVAVLLIATWAPAIYESTWFGERFPALKARLQQPRAFEFPTSQPAPADEPSIPLPPTPTAPSPEAAPVDEAPVIPPPPATPEPEIAPASPSSVAPEPSADPAPESIPNSAEPTTAPATSELTTLPATSAPTSGPASD